MTRRRYDANGNKVFEQGPSAKYYMAYSYDFANRLIAEERICPNEPSIKQSHRYNYLGQRIAMIDEFGNETTYSYDDLGRLTETKPPALNQVQLCSTQAYDIAGNVTEFRDFQGNVTRKRYNIRVCLPMLSIQMAPPNSLNIRSTASSSAIPIKMAHTLSCITIA